MTDDLHESRVFWDRWARKDPLWAVFSFDDKTNRRWDLNEFMERGEREIALLWHQLETLGVEAPASALDFGTGLGRLAQALGRRCDRVIGVDIAPNMTRRRGISMSCCGWSQPGARWCFSSHRTVGKREVRRSIRCRRRRTRRASA